VTTAPRTATREVTEPNVWKPDPGERVEQIQRLPGGQIAFSRAAWQWSHGFHLDIDRHLSEIRPVGVQHGPWQDVQLSVGARVVSNPTQTISSSVGTVNGIHALWTSSCQSR
jgi:hypothetical protein